MLSFVILRMTLGIFETWYHSKSLKQGEMVEKARDIKFIFSSRMRSVRFRLTLPALKIQVGVELPLAHALCSRHRAGTQKV